MPFTKNLQPKDEKFLLSYLHTIIKQLHLIKYKAFKIFSFSAYLV